jgi:serine/threonine protein kinase
MTTTTLSPHPALTIEMPARLFGYEVIDLIGAGAGSVIYAVTHPQTRQILALKHVERKTDKDIRYIEQLETEFEIGRLVKHDNLRKVVDLQMERTLLRKITSAALIMELFDGAPIDVHPLKGMAAIIDCFLQTGHALHAMHTAGYVHCDLKPSNILVNSEGLVKVIDLGQACRIGTAKQRIQGTPDYIAPEQVKCLPVTVRTDVFNFGATMYFALTGQKLPTLFTLKRTENSFLVDGKFASPRDLNANVPENLSNLVMECVRTKPEKRPENMEEVTRSLHVIRHTVTRANNDSKFRMGAMA